MTNLYPRNGHAVGDADIYIGRGRTDGGRDVRHRSDQSCRRRQGARGAERARAAGDVRPAVLEQARAEDGIGADARFF